MPPVPCAASGARSTLAGAACAAMPAEIASAPPTNKLNVRFTVLLPCCCG
jgi:hypothetical protein